MALSRRFRTTRQTQGGSSPLALLEGLRHRACRPVLLLILLPLAHRLLVLSMDHVPVDVERGADATVPQTCGYGWYRHAGGQEVGDVGVPQEVERTALRLGDAEAREKVSDGAR